MLKRTGAERTKVVGALIGLSSMGLCVSPSISSSTMRSLFLTHRSNTSAFTSCTSLVQQNQWRFQSTSDSNSSSDPPAWIDSLRSAAKTAEKNISYDIKIYNELSWRKTRFEFKKDTWDPHTMSSVLRSRLCLGKEEAEYTIIGEAFPFPDKEDSPVINEPNFACRLLWDHTSPTEKIMIQLSDHFPPLLWITVKPTLEALKKVFSEFIDVDAQHMKKYLPYYESVQNQLETSSNETFGDTLSNTRMKDRFIEDMRKKDPKTLEMDWDKEHSFYLGNVDHFRVTEDKLMKSNPFVFGWPLLVGDGNHHLEGTPFRMSAFRTIYSKSLLMINSRLDMQLDHRQAELTAYDDPDVVLEVPIFCTVNYPSNTRMCGGAALVKRFNNVMGTSFPEDTPVDVLAVFCKENTVKAVPELLEELKFLYAASQKAPDRERVIRLSQDMLSGNRIIGQLAYTIVYLAIIGHETFIEDVFMKFKDHPSDLIRVACAKGAHVMLREDLIGDMIATESEERVRLMLERCRVGVNQEDNESTRAPDPTAGAA